MVKNSIFTQGYVNSRGHMGCSIYYHFTGRWEIVQYLNKDLVFLKNQLIPQSSLQSRIASAELLLYVSTPTRTIEQQGATISRSKSLRTGP